MMDAVAVRMLSRKGRLVGAIVRLQSTGCYALVIDGLRVGEPSTDLPEVEARAADLGAIASWPQM